MDSTHDAAADRCRRLITLHQSGRSWFRLTLVQLSGDSDAPRSSRGQAPHLALQFDPEWVEAWTDREVAERWNRLYQRADMNHAEQEGRIKAWLVQEGKSLPST